MAEVNEQVPSPTARRSPRPRSITRCRSPAAGGGGVGEIGEADEAIARHAAGYIGDGSVLQTGVGAVPDAMLRLLHDRKDLGVHSGMLATAWSTWSRPAWSPMRASRSTAASRSPAP